MLYGPKCHTDGIKGQGYTENGIMLLGIAPGKQEMQSHVPMSGPSGLLTNNLLEACGWHRDKTYATNLMCYENPEPSGDEVMACWPRLAEEIKLVKPKLVIPLGKFVSEILFPLRSFGDIRGSITWYEPWQCHLMPTFHPAAILHSKKGAGPGIASDIVFDFKKIQMFLADHAAGITSRMKYVYYDVVRTREQAQQLLDSLPTDRIVAIDVETTSQDVDIIDAQVDKLICLAITVLGEPLTWVFPVEVLRQGLDWPVNIQWTGHYATFDMQIILGELGIDLPIVHDTLLLHYMLDERAGRFARHGLKPVSRAYAYAGFYEDDIKKERKKNKMVNVPRERTYAYNADDTANTAFLADRFIHWVKEEGMWDVYERTMAFANIAKYMQYRGLHISKERLVDLGVEWIPMIVEKENALLQTVERLGGDPNMNLGSNDQLGRFLFGTLNIPCVERTPTGKPQVTKDVLELLADEHPFVTDLIDLTHLKHLVSAYIIGIKDDIKKTGRVHPTPMLHGTVAGRLAYSNPAINTIPASYTDSPYGPKLRKLFTASDDDHVILEFDYKQAEIWMAAAYSNDPQMWEDLRSGDIHRKNAAFINNILENLVTTAQRWEAKRTTFGKIYLIGDDKLAKQTNKTLLEARVFSRLWDRRYATYIKHTTRLFNEAKATGEVRTKTGRVRRFPLIVDGSTKNQVVNFPLQASSHDYVMESINSSYYTLRDTFDAHILLDLHDAILVEAKKSNWKHVAEHMVKTMSTQFFGDILPQVPVEVKMGESWGECHEIEL